MTRVRALLFPIAIVLLTTGAFSGLRAQNPAPVAPPQGVECTFDTPGAIIPAQTDPTVAGSLADDPASKTSKCLEMTFKKGSGVHTFDLSTTKGLQSKDLAHFDAIDVEVFNPANTPQPYFLSLRSGWGEWPPQQGIAEKFEVASGKWQTVRIDLASLFNRCDVSPINLKDFFLSPSQLQISRGDCILYVRKISLVRLDLPADLDRLAGLLDKLKPLDHLPARIINPARTLLGEKDALLKQIAVKSITEQDEQKLIDEAQRAYRLLLPVYGDKDLWLKHLNDGRQALAAVAPQVAKPEFGVGLASPLQKVFLDELPFPGTFGTSLSFSLARNECENAQVVVFAETRNLANVSISSSDLTGEGGTVIPAANVRVSPVGYVKLAYHPPYDGFYQHIQWWPDPILTFMDKINIEQDATQPFWVRVRTNKDTKPGKYRGSLSINADGCAPVKIDVTMDVWDFELPDKSSLQTAIYFGWRYAKAVHETHKRISMSSIGWDDPPLAADLTARYQQFLLDYKIFPTQLYTKSPPDISFLKRCKQEGTLGLINLAYIDCSHPPRYYLGRLDKIIPELKEAGLYDNAILYGFDEFTAEKADKIAAELRPIKQAYPDLKIMATLHFDPFATDSPLKDLIDIWVPIYDHYPKSADAEKYRKMGKQVWWYTCMADSGPDNFFYSPPIQIRGLVGAGAMRSHTDGWLYWCSNYWESQTTPLETGPLTDWDVRGIGPPGGGSLMYAGPTGPAPSVRLENYRDGIEDYDYYKILQQRLTEAETQNIIPDGKLDAARKLLGVHWNPYGDPAVLIAERNKLAEAILSLR